MIYSLYEIPAENRVCIDTEQRKGYSTPLEGTSVPVDCWIRAKHLMGYELTDMQKNMLEAKDAAQT